ncbi:MAG: ParB/RepB/Spo0J family partition protein [Proteobacteria bacterium]|nr:ParB/RepB/Spo0J family partition protein [Pseudomonadota bacterium]MBU1137417.1 ParB/RepB/Spo0J family partition protein [Pseudomonadota bacterium]MBU1234436.1 ParB/RepB/Spo0J family partition protein [Pseudomonadota bacterium]
MAIKKGLGRGVDLLFNQEQVEEKYFECEIKNVIPNQYQPRSYFDEESLRELADSIKANGIIQPLVVVSNSDGTYGLIAGERRLRASKLVGLQTVPVVLREISGDDELLELALIENVQRKDLNPMEEAEAYEKLIQIFSYTQEQAAQKVGKKRSTVTNRLRLLQLPDFIKNDISSSLISEGHARALLRLSEDSAAMKEARDQIVDKGLSVRQAEKLTSRMRQTTRIGRTSSPKETNTIPTSFSHSLLTRMTNRLHSKVQLVQNGSRGKLEIEYYSLDDLERVVDLITGDGD